MKRLTSVGLCSGNTSSPLIGFGGPAVDMLQVAGEEIAVSFSQIGVNETASVRDSLKDVEKYYSKFDVAVVVQLT